MKTVRFRDSRKELPVGKILCLGRNYRDHAVEMNAEIPETPVVFLKPSTALTENDSVVVIPPFSHELHHEVELVVVIGREGKAIDRRSAFDHVIGYAVGLDMTLRDIQTDAKKKGLPWSVAKGFDTSAPVSAIVPRELVPDPHILDISLTVNGSPRQHSNTARMIFPIDYVVSYLSTIFTLEPGDLIFTGTPEGVGTARPGDLLEGSISSIGSLTVHIASMNP